MDSPLALYRRYRPETFAEVIGQEHVTEPLRNALANDRVNHAYLFSGPRGCGKTTSARILARALNCARAPIADPCGECDSCRDLARGGSGSIDVIEIDAASHGGVDDARDLREKAFFAPVRDRYKIYIIDEAHMVSTQGFNALLKLVEEPPPHLRFIFATTEPEKVIPTIRSRTHHYPFRLIPPRLLSDYLTRLCAAEGVPIEGAALPLVVRAGGGSARDTLSVLDQLLGGSGPEGVTHQLASSLLGYTPDSLLDEMVDAFAARDGGGVFRVVDKVVETGQDPRRFTEDLLRRLRDLVIVSAVPDAPATGLIDVSVDAGERLVAQANHFGVIELSRAADLVAAGLTEMRGATAPRLLLELICARVLLPGADHTNDGVMARLDRLEKRFEIAGAPPAPRAAADPPASPPQPPAQPSRPVPPIEEVAPPTVRAEPEVLPATRDEPPAPAPTEPPGWGSTPGPAAAPQRPVDPAPSVAATEPTSPESPGALSLADVRNLWPSVVEATKSRRRLAWMHLTQNCQVVAVDGATLALGFSNVGARDSFVSSGCDEIVRQSAIDVIGTAWRIEAIIDPGATPDVGYVATSPAVTPEPPVAPVPTAPVDPVAAPSEPPAWATPDAAAPMPTESPVPPARPDPLPAEQAPTDLPPTDPAAIAAARNAIQATRVTGERTPQVDHGALADAEVRFDDPEVDSGVTDARTLVERELGGTVIEEIPHS